MLSIAHACALMGLDGELVEVQVDFNPRAVMPNFSIVGLPDSAVKESRERVRAAIKNSGLGYPNKAYVVNLSPADLPKHGPSYDLPIAVAVLAATDQIPLDALQKSLFIGELSLDGRVRHVKGAMPISYAAALAGFERVFVPTDDAFEAALVKDIQVFPVETIGELVEFFYGMREIKPIVLSQEELEYSSDGEHVDFADVKGQEHVKRALEIAAAGNHNLRLVGPPGVGKSLLARAIPGILPRLSFEEALEVTRIYSVVDMLRKDSPLMRHRPFRAPHHTILSIRA